MSSPSSLFSQGSMDDVALHPSDDKPVRSNPPHISTASTITIVVKPTKVIPPIPGLHVFSGLLNSDIARTLSTESGWEFLIIERFLEDIIQADHFIGGSRDQVMFFGRRPICTTEGTTSPSIGIPNHLLDIATYLSELLSGVIPENTWDIVFNQDLGRQCILNLYPPGQGISPHIDLPHRYADGIVGVSLLGGTVINFQHPTKGSYSLYLPPRSVYVLSKEARWEWSHGIPGRVEDVVDGQTIGRGVRVSVTFRWMKEGADVLL